MKLRALAILVIALSSCDGERLYEKNREFSNRTWYMDSIPSFTFNISQPGTNYDIYLNLRNTLSYPFQNIYLTYYLEDSLGNTLSQDLVNFQLFDTKTGKPFGSGGIGDVYDHQFNLLEGYSFPAEGTYELKLEQYMRRDSLPQIVAVGVRVEQNKSED